LVELTLKYVATHPPCHSQLDDKPTASPATAMEAYCERHYGVRCAEDGGLPLHLEPEVT